MTQNEGKPLHLAFYGFNGKAKEILRIALAGQGKNIATMSEDGPADAAIFNMDGPNMEQTLANCLKRYPDRPAIVIGSRDPGLKNTIYLSKPVRISEMVQAINRCHPAAQAHEQTTPADKPPAPAENNAGNFTPIDINKGRTVFENRRSSETSGSRSHGQDQEDWFYDPAEFIQQTLFTALDESLKNQTAMQIDILSGANGRQQITLLPEEMTVSSTMNDEQLQKLCSTPLCLIEHTLHKCKDEVTVYMKHHETPSANCDSYDSFRVKIALWTGLGRVPASTTLSTSVTLTRWPNLTRLPAIGHAMPISALLIDQPRPLPLVAKTLNLELEDTFDFYCASLALGILKQAADGQAARRNSGKHKKHRHHSLFGSILSHLRGNPAR